MQYLYKNYSSKFIIEPTKYSKYYFLIIERAINEQRTKLKKSDSSYVYYENHHILPKSLFPEFKNLKDNPWNSVLLTAREHFLIHALIYKHFKSLNHQWMYKMGRAFMIMKAEGTTINCRNVNSIAYQYFKLNIKMSDETKKKMSESRRGFRPSDETKKKMSERAKNRTAEHQQKINESKKLNFNEETRKRQSLAKIGKTHSDETKKKMSESRKGKCTDIQRENLAKNNLKASKSILINDVVYISISDASRLLNISKYLIRKRLYDRENLNYICLEDTIYSVS